MKGILVYLWMAVLAALPLARQAPSGSNETYRDEAEAVVRQLPQHAREMDDPTLRILLRLKLISFLQDKGVGSGSARSVEAYGLSIEPLVKDALDDFKSHKEDVLGIYAPTFRSELLTASRKLGPEGERRLVDQYAFLQEDPRAQLQSANELITAKTGSASAIESVQRILSSGKDPGSSMVFFLQKVKEENPALMPDVLGAILTSGAQAGGLSANLLFWTGSFFLTGELPPESKVLYLTLALSAIEREQPWPNAARAEQDYRLLNNIFPAIQTLAPPLFQRARELMVLLTTHVPPALVDRVAAENRISQSGDRLTQVLTEVSSTKDDTLREDLAIQAAQIALAKKQTKIALELALQISGDSERGSWRSHFLTDLVEQALREKDGELALDAASRITPDLDRAGAMEKIALYFYQAKDTSRAREILNETVKVVNSSENGADKVRRLLALATSFAKIDQIRVLEVLQMAVKVVNSIPRPLPSEPAQSKSRIEYARTLAQIAWNITPAFQRLVRVDQLQTWAIANGIQNKEIHAFAAFGAATGILGEGPSSKARAETNMK